MFNTRSWILEEPKRMYGFSLVHEDDRPPVVDIQPDITSGPWIAGGAVLKWYHSKPVKESDIDVFFHDLRQFDEVFGRLMRQGANIVYNSDNAITLNYNAKDTNRGHRIQLIRRRWFNSAEEVIKNFDFTICQLLTDGSKIISGDLTAGDIKNNLIRHTDKEIQKDVIKRIIKYTCYGYRLHNDLSNYIEEHTDELNWGFNADADQYENAF